jgi:hypothetical protein
MVAWCILKLYLLCISLVFNAAVIRRNIAVMTSKLIIIMAVLFDVERKKNTFDIKKGVPGAVALLVLSHPHLLPRTREVTTKRQQ